MYIVHMSYIFIKMIFCMDTKRVSIKGRLKGRAATDTLKNRGVPERGWNFYTIHWCA